MTAQWRRWSGKLSLPISLISSGAIPVGIAWLYAVSADCVLAQAIIPDGTLGADNSVVIPTTINSLPAEEIRGGAIRGTNLFHSFGKFDVTEGQRIYFANPTGIENILSRVTGNDPTNILGTLGVQGNANLFLINPQGILFGPNAKLEVNGSFLASTADSLVFDNGLAFSATNPQTPPLLAINVPIGLQYTGNAGSIQVQGSRLQVPNGETLALVGGNLRLEGGRLLAPGGRVELAGVAGVGTVGLNGDGSFSFPDRVARADVSLTNGTEVNVRAGGGGQIGITAGNIELLGNTTRLVGGIAGNAGSLNAQAGDIRLSATGAITLQSSQITNNVERNASGNSGNIAVATGSLFVRDGAQIHADVMGNGNAGNLTIKARDTVSVDGVGLDAEGEERNSRIRSWVGERAVGNGGDITIEAGSVELTNGGRVNLQVRGQGDAGNLSMVARDSVRIDGAALVDGDPTGSGVVSQFRGRGEGRSGNIHITARSVSLTNGGELLSNTLGQGDAGDITILAQEYVVLDGVNPLGPDSAIVSSVGVENRNDTARGEGGNIRIEVEAGSLFVTNGAKIEAATFAVGNAGDVTIIVRDTVSLDGVGGVLEKQGNSSIGTPVGEDAVGNGGDISIEAESVYLTNGSRLNLEVSGQGNAGTLSIVARDTVRIDGAALVGRDETGSGVMSQIKGTGIGRGGDIDIVARSVSLTDGGELLSDTYGQGNAGNITILAQEGVVVDGVSALGPDSAIVSTAQRGSTGEGGNIRIEVADGSLLITNGGKIETATEAEGNAGNVTIFTRDAVVLDGEGSSGFSRISANTSETSGGDGGDVRITTGELIVRDKGEVNVSSYGSGNAGSLTVHADSIFLDNQGKLRASTALGEGGNISLQARDLILMRRNSLISARAENNGNGGNIAINAPFIVAVPEENSDIIANAVLGRGGNIRITTDGIYGLEYRLQLTPLSDINASSEFGVNGTVQINTPDVDPSQGLAKLPSVPVNDVEVAQSCPGKGDRETIGFFTPGRGGLAPNPYEVLSSSELWEDMPLPTQRTENFATAADTSGSLATSPEQIVEAQGWIVNEKGEVILVAEMPTFHSQGRCRIS